MGGNLTARTSGATLNSITINGSEQHAVGSAVSQWNIIDARGTGAAWTLSVSGTDFKSAAGTQDNIVRTIDISNLNITTGRITRVLGSDEPPEEATITVRETANALLTVVGAGKGAYFLTPKFDLTVPSNSYRSNYAQGNTGTMNPYVSTITLTIA